MFHPAIMTADPENAKVHRNQKQQQIKGRYVYIRSQQ
jgi:hypothetical protein